MRPAAAPATPDRSVPPQGLKISFNDLAKAMSSSGRGSKAPAGGEWRRGREGVGGVPRAGSRTEGSQLPFSCALVHSLNPMPACICQNCTRMARMMLVRQAA